MTSPNSKKLRESVAKSHWRDAVSLLESLPAKSSAQELSDISFDQQRELFRHLPQDLGVALIPHFRYYDQYVLLHSLGAEEMRALVEKLNPDDRMRFFDELPEEAWQRLMDELSGAGTETTRQPESKVAPSREQSPRPAEAIIEARQIEKRFELPEGKEVQVIAPIDLSIESNTICALLGPSGSGKSTLLRMLSGLSKPTSGTVLWHRTSSGDANRSVGIVFQSFALFPWLTVLENVEVPLEAKGLKHADQHLEALKALAMVGLKGFENAYPKELSGGMKQRSAWRARWQFSLKYSSWTSHSPLWMS